MKESFSRLRQLYHHNNDSIRLYENIQTDDYPAHWNGSFEVILPVENSYQVRIFETLFDICDEEILIIPAGSVHEMYYAVRSLQELIRYAYPDHVHDQDMH